MPFKNTENQYGNVAIGLHWIIAAIVISLLILGLYMTGLPIGLQKLKLYGWHKEFGILVLLLGIIRIAWRLSNKTPYLPTHLPAWQKLAAHGAHFALYFLMLVMPLTGWMMSSASGLPVSFFGLFILPDLVEPNEQLRFLLVNLHQWLGYGFIAVICLHTGAALQHHFIYKDTILRRILPFYKP